MLRHILSDVITERLREQRNRASAKWKQKNPERVRVYQRRRYQEKSGELKEYRKNYYHSHKSECADYHKKWTKRNLKRRLQYLKRYNATRKESQKEYDRLRYLRPENAAKREALKDHKKSYMAKWIRKNRDKHIAAWHKRKALKHGNGIGDTKLIARWIKGWRNSKRVACYWCKQVISGTQVHMDHIESLNKGGRHSIENLCVSCKRCNQTKHDKLLSIWNQQITEPILL